MRRSDKDLYKVKATMMIPLEVEVLMRADSSKDAKLTTDCLQGMGGRWEYEIILNKDMYNQYEIDSYEQVLKETVNDLDWSVEVDFDKEPVKACILCYEPLDVIKDENGEVIYDDGNDALPLADGRCCNACDFKVTVARLAELKEARG